MNAAYLGPVGSYTELALSQFLPKIEAVPTSSIPEVFRAVVNGSVKYGLVPLENLIQGPVTETLDQLLLYKNTVHITASHTMVIVHCLGIPAEAVDCEISEIHSHEQALRQCSQFLQEQYPKASLITANSTGAAAVEISRLKTGKAAVIAAESTLTKSGFKIIARDIANDSGNKTRFALIKLGVAGEQVEANLATTKLAENTLAPLGLHVCSIAIDPGKDRQGILHELMQVISVEHQINLLSIHSRPDRKGGFIFHFDLEGSISSPRIINCLISLNSYCSLETGSTAEIIVCGSYWQERFFEPPITCIGIIGSQGVMGLWFQSFFAAAGISVKLCDRDVGHSLAEITQQCDVLLLSIPMSAFPEIVPQLVPHLRAGHLVVENCSVKSCALPALSSSVPEGVEVLGIHTMFGGDLKELKGENIIVTRTETSGPKADALEAIFYKYGANITQVSGKEHDQRTAFLQALIHCVMLSLAEVMRKNFSSPVELEAFLTPNSRSVLAVLERVLNQSDELLLDLQTLNAEYPKERREFLQTTFNLLTALDNQNLEIWHKSIQESREYLKKTTKG